MNSYRMTVFNWGVVMVLFIIIALSSIGLILSPAVTHTKVGEEEQVSAPSSLTTNGLIARAETWKKYPEYNIGLGFMAALSFLGALHVCRVMYSLKETEDALQSNSRRLDHV